MLVRVLIVIVVVGVLGFFGTRGSEKVVAEVTERQEVVDDLAKRVAQLEEKNRALEAQLAQQREQQTQIASDLQRTTDQLHQRLTDLERREAARVAATPATTTIRLVIGRPALIFVDGKPALYDAPPATPAIHLPVGKHSLELDNGQKRVRYALLVRQATDTNSLIVEGTTARVVGDLVITRDR
jgi:TolA-binding protein